MRWYLCIFLFMIGCKTTSLIQTNNRYNLTKGKKFKLENKFALPDSSDLSISNIYLCKCTDDGGSRWFKFYKNGKVTHSVTIKHKSGLVDTFSLGGYYTYIDGSLTIEISHGVSNGMITGDEWGVAILKGKIVQKDTLSFFSDKWNGKGKNLKAFTGLKKVNGEDCYYIKSKKSYFFRSLDW